MTKLARITSAEVAPDHWAHCCRAFWAAKSIGRSETRKHVGSRFTGRLGAARMGTTAWRYSASTELYELDSWTISGSRLVDW